MANMNTCQQGMTSSKNRQGSHSLHLIKFPDFFLTFPDFSWLTKLRNVKVTELIYEIKRSGLHTPLKATQSSTWLRKLDIVNYRQIRHLFYFSNLYNLNHNTVFISNKTTVISLFQKKQYSTNHERQSLAEVQFHARTLKNTPSSTQQELASYLNP